MPVGNAAGHTVSSWLNPTCVFIGVLAVVSCAYLAAVYLAADAARAGEPELEQAFRVRALGAGALAGLVAIGGIFALRSDGRALYDALTTGRALPAVIVSALAGLATLALVYTRRFEWARYCAAAAVAAIVAGMALARWPTILPGLTVYEAAAGHDTLVWVVVAVLAGAAILFPSLVLLFRLTLGGGMHYGSAGQEEAGAKRLPAVAPAVGVRAALACLIVGVGLLNVADAGWAHAVGVVALGGFVARRLPDDHPGPAGAVKKALQPLGIRSPSCNNCYKPWG